MSQLEIFGPAYRDLQETVGLKVRECFERAGELWPDHQFELPQIKFDLRGRTAGQAFYKENRLRFNMVLLKENGDRFINRTVPHECAHLITRAVFGNSRKIKSHGKEWKYVMHKLGVEDSTRCHSYDTTNSRVSRKKRYPYRCGCQDYNLTSIRHNRIRKGKVYRCKYCGKELKYGKKKPDRQIKARW